MDTDIVSCNNDWALQRIVIFTSLCKCLDKLGYGKALLAYRVNAICASLGPDTTRAMPLLHSLTGCDTTSCFMGRGKKSTWEAWKSYREVTDAFLYLADNPYYHWDTESPNFKLLERFQHGSLWQGKQWNIRKWSKNPGEYTTHTDKCNNPIFLVDSTRKITAMKI